MSIKRTNSQSYIQNRQSNGFQQRTSDRYTSKDEKPMLTTTLDTQSNAVLLKKSQKLIQSSKRRRPVAPDKLKLMRHVFTTISNSQSSKIQIYISSNKFSV